jgi:hypothetical protein
MTKLELKRAVEIATSDVSLADTDHSVLFGLATKEFRGPVTTTYRVVARMVRELAVAFNGTVDPEALSEFGNLARHRILVVG